MAYPAIDNGTPFAFELLFLADEEGRQLIAPVGKATYAISEKGHLVLAEKPMPVNPAGEYFGDPNLSSYKYEPETAFIKPTTDVVLIGHAHAPRSGVNETLVSLQAGPIKKTMKVVGDRVWGKALGKTMMTNPVPFEKIPLIYERAFGGWDRSHSDPTKHTFEPRNPVGTGFRSKKGNFEEGIRLPNLEDPKYPLKSYGDTPPPAGFGFISPNWQPRAARAGTYDDKWMKERMPLLPTDFDRRFFNAASTGLIASGYLKGNEPVLIENASPSGKMTFQLPGVPPPKIHVELRGGVHHDLTTNLDTVIINTYENVLFLLWRTHLEVRRGPQDVVAIQVSAEGVPTAAVVS
jgi:hypothetical protein